MIKTRKHNERRAYTYTNQGVCKCGEKFLKRGTGKYCNDCKVLRISPQGRAKWDKKYE